MKRISLPLLFVLPLFFASCTDGTGDFDTGEVNRTDQFVNMPDDYPFQPGWSVKNEVIMHLVADPDNLHPTNGKSSIRRVLFNYLHKSLVSLDLEKGGLKPLLVKEFPEAGTDGRSYTFQLRDDIRWDDGTPLTHADVLFSLKACKCPLTDNAHAKSSWALLENVLTDPGDPQKFTVVMKQKSMTGISLLTDCYIIRQKLYDPKNILAGISFIQMNDTAFNPAAFPGLQAWADSFNHVSIGRDPLRIQGLGPYRLISWDEGQTIVMEKKAGEDQAFPDRIIFKMIKDPNALMLALKAQEIDGSASLPPKIYIELKKDSDFNRNYHADVIETYNYTFLAMNMRPGGIRKKLFTDKKVRKAMALLTPVDQVIKTLNFGMNKRISGPVLPLKEEYNTSLKLIPYDPPLAKRLLSEAGWADTDGDDILDKVIEGQKTIFELDLMFHNAQPEWKDFALMLSESYHAAGIKVNLLPTDAPILFSKASNHDFDMVLSAWSGNSLPEDHSELWHTSSWKNNGNNYTGFGSAGTDALLDSLENTTKKEDYERLSHRLQQIIYDEQPYIFLYQGNMRLAAHKRFKNIRMYKERPGLLLSEWRLIEQ